MRSFVRARLTPAFLATRCASRSFIESVAGALSGRQLPASATHRRSAALPIPLPPPAEQRAIAAFLDRETGRVDRLVAKKRELIERLKEKRTALISRTVTRGLPPAAARAAGLPANPPLKPSGLDWLGDIPKHWEVVTFESTSALRCKDRPRIRRTRRMPTATRQFRSFDRPTSKLNGSMPSRRAHIEPEWIAARPAVELCALATSIAGPNWRNARQAAFVTDRVRRCTVIHTLIDSTPTAELHTPVLLRDSELKSWSDVTSTMDYTGARHAQFMRPNREDSRHRSVSRPSPNKPPSPRIWTRRRRSWTRWWGRWRRRWSGCRNTAPPSSPPPSPARLMCRKEFHA